MTPETRKRLTLFIGECPHEFVNDEHPSRYHCSICNTRFDVRKEFLPQPRSFSTPTDAQVVKDKLVEKGLWRSFEDYINSIWVENEWKPFALNHHAGGKSQCKTVMQWLFSYTRDLSGNVTGYRLCDLAGEFMEVGK